MSELYKHPQFEHRYIPGWQLTDKRTLLLLHGTGGNETDLLPLGRRLAPQAALLSPRGKVLEDGKPRFFRRLSEGVFDEEDLKFRAKELADFVKFTADVYSFDPDKIVAVGYSNGANIAAAILLLHPGVFKSAILFRPMVPLIPETMPDLTKTSVFISAGRTDPLVPPEETERLVKLLEDAKANVTLYWTQGAHALSEEDIDAAREWLESGP